MSTRAVAAATGWNAWSWYWLALNVSWFVLFIVPELWAIFSGRPENTLSAQVWRLEQFAPGHAGPIWSWTAMHVLIGGMIAVLLLWLLGHFVFGLWT